MIIFVILFFSWGFACQASEVFFNFSEEAQSFYLNPQNSASFLSRTELQTKGAIDLIENLKFKLDHSISYTFLNKQDQNGFLFNPQNLGFLLSEKKFEVFAGGFTLAGDGADLNNIFDVINPKDYRQPFNSKSIGSVGILFSLPFDSFSLKSFYIPKNTKSRMPDTQSPWWPRTDALPVKNSSGTFLSPDNMSYVLAGEAEEKKPFENNYGLISKYTFEKIDLNFFYFSGANQTPQIRPEINIDVTSFDPLVGVVKPPVGLNYVWYRSEHLGGGLTFVLDDWITKIFCKQQKDFLSVEQKSSACTASVENSLSVFNSSLRYFLQLNRIWKDSSSVSELETLLGFFEKSSALGFYLDMNNSGTVSGAAIYNEKDPAWLFSLGYEARITEKLKTKLSANVLSTSGCALGNAYDKTDNLSLVISSDF